MSRVAWSYILAVIALGIGICLASLTGPLPMGYHWFTFTILALAAVLAQFFEVADARQSYYLHTVFFFAGVIVLPPILFVLLVAVPHTVEWLQKRLSGSPLLRDWYLQPFNIATHVISGFTARWIFFLFDGSTSQLAFPDLIAAPTMAVATYVVINHLLIGQALVLARGMSWKDLGILDTEILLTETVTMFIGYTFAVLWNISPWLSVPAAAPLVLIYRAMTVPQLQREAQTDEKTGLWNARHFDRLLHIEMRKAQELGRPISLIMGDLDLLRNINNSYGHLAGDAVLTGVANVLQQHIRGDDFAGRFGGEEFAIVLSNTDISEALIIAERLRQAVAETAYMAATHSEPISASMSFGVAAFPLHGKSVRSLIHEADVALYQAKLSGRNAVRSASDVPYAIKLDFDSQQINESEIDQPEIAHTFADFSLPDEPNNVSVASAEYHRNYPLNYLAIVPQQPASDPERPSAAPTEEPVRSTPSIVFIAYVGLVIGGGIFATLASVPSFSSLDITALILLVLLTATSELLQISVYGQNTVSVSMAVAFATAIIMGLPGVAVVSAVIVMVHFGRMRPPFYRTLFNWATHVLAGSVPVILIFTLHLTLGVSNLPLLIVLSGIAALLYYLIETGLIAIAISLSSGLRVSVTTTWQEQFRWLGKYYLLMGILGLFLTIAYSQIGPIGLFVFVLPVFLIHFAQREYVQGTETSMQELRRMNQELGHANEQVSQASFAIRNLNNQLFDMLAKLIDARDPYVSDHAIQVTSYAVAIAQNLGMSERQLERIRQAAMLHDIGKIGISDAILRKPARLTDEEYEEIKRHAALGASFIESYSGLADLAPAVRHHHEWWNGQGYPNRLRGETIPLEARILAVCDAVEAMASDRPYQSAKPLSEILRELRRCSGTQFDPKIVDAFSQVVAQEGDGFVINTVTQTMRVVPGYTFATEMSG